MTELVTILGATGSVGRQTLAVIDQYPNDYQLFALTAHHSWRQLATACERYRPRYAVMADAEAATLLRNHLKADGSDTQVLDGNQALTEVAAASEVDTVVAAIVGAAGVEPTLAAVRQGKRVLLANKEALVVTGALFTQAVRDHGATLLPLDSEHSAIFQCLPAGTCCPPATGLSTAVEKLLLTASGGPFRQWSRAQIERASVAEALAHPNWKMGPKISIDSASLMNKGLEMIEACWLFGVTPADIEVVVHPQSVVHSMVQYRDGAVLAQLGTPDMRTPIALGLAWPARIESGASRLDFRQLADLSFEAPDEQRFPCLALARNALQAGGTATAVLNAANEEAVAAFLDARIDFMRIPQLVEAALEKVAAPACTEVSDVMQVDDAARRFVRQQLVTRCL